MKIRVGDLKRLIRENLNEEGPMVQPDPFKEPSDKPDLPQFGKNVLHAEKLLGDMPKVLDQMSKTTKNPKTQALLRKGAGLAYHASNDLKALEAVITIAVKEMQKN